MLGNRAIYHDGWMAVTTPVTLPWELNTAPPPDVITGYKWELYNLNEDVTEYNDLAAQDAGQAQGDCRMSSTRRRRSTTCCRSTTRRSRAFSRRVRAPTAGRTVFTYSGELSGVPPGAAPNILQKSYTITAEVEIPGGRRGRHDRHRGRALRRLRLVSEQRRVGSPPGQGRVSLQSARSQAHDLGRAGTERRQAHHRVRLQVRRRAGFGKGGTGVLSVDGKEVDKKHMEHTTPIMFPEDEDFDVGMDTRTGVALVEYRYDCPFKFTGKINKLTFDLGPAQYTDEDRKKLPAIAAMVAGAKD